MKKSTLTGEQIVGFPNQDKGGAAIKDFGRKHCFSGATYYMWCSRLDGLGGSGGGSLAARIGIGEQ